MTLMMPGKLRVAGYGVRTWSKKLARILCKPVLYQLKYICRPHDLL